MSFFPPKVSEFWRELKVVNLYHFFPPALYPVGLLSHPVNIPLIQVGLA